MTIRTEPAASEMTTDGTVRIEHDRRRLLLRLLAGVFALVAIGVALTVTLLHFGEQPARITGVDELDGLLRKHAYGPPWWAPCALAFAAAAAALGLLRTALRLQDGDPALVVSTRGLRFRPTAFGEQATVPWTAIRDIKMRQYKQHRYLLLRVDEIDRYVPRLGLRGWLRRMVRSGARDGTVALGVLLSKAEWKKTESLLRAYLARYGSTERQTSASRR